MNRFQPDTVGHALMRFFDMAAPDANVYIEIPAPDLRFAAIVLLAGVAAVLWRWLGPGRRPTFAFFALLLLSTAIWLGTTGNGRYFMAMIVAAGPLAIALVCLLPVTRLLKASLALLLVGGQAFVLTQQPPWNTWTLGHWTDTPYFKVELGPEELQGGPVTYASMSILSYSLIAPQFPAGARWTNLYTTPINAADARRTEAFLQRALAEGPVKVLAPTVPEAALPDGTPNAEMVRAIDKLIAPRNLRISGRCHLIPSPGMTRMATRGKVAAEGAAWKFGFWSCPVAHHRWAPDTKAHDAAPAHVQQAFARLGELCPAYFPPWEKSSFRVADGWSRHFDSDTRVYVLDSGEVWFKFWRSLNPVRVGTVAALLSGEATLDCSRVRGSDRAWISGRQ